jgi:hypothetical protein
MLVRNVPRLFELRSGFSQSSLPKTNLCDALFGADDEPGRARALESLQALREKPLGIVSITVYILGMAQRDLRPADRIRLQFRLDEPPQAIFE